MFSSQFLISFVLKFLYNFILIYNFFSGGGERAQVHLLLENGPLAAFSLKEAISTEVDLTEKVGKDCQTPGINAVSADLMRV